MLCFYVFQFGGYAFNAVDVQNSLKCYKATQMQSKMFNNSSYKGVCGP